MDFKRKHSQTERDEEAMAISDVRDVGMKQNVNFLSLIAIGFNASNSWIAVASSLPLAISSGSSVTLLYGILIVSLAMLCTGLSLAELASVFPTTGGQYHIASYIAPISHSRWISYVCGLAAVLSWIAIASSISFIITEFTVSLAVAYNPEFVPQRWHYFLIYEVMHSIAIGVNLLVINKVVRVYDLTFVISLSLFVVVSIVCPVRTLERPTTGQVWTIFRNNSNGWPDAIVFLTGLATSSYMLIGLDATMHLAEECTNPIQFVPRAIMSTVLTGISTAFIFSIAMSYSAINMDSLLDSPIPMTIYVLWESSTRSSACATAFAAAIVWIAFIALNAVQQTASRLTWSFACDDAITCSRFISTIHAKLQVPIYALIFNYIACLIIGILYLASSSAFNAFINTASILSQFSISIPMAVLLVQRRSSDYLPPNRNFRLPHTIGYICNVVSVVWAVILIIFLCFPTSFPVSGGSMNYTAVVIGIMAVLGTLNWTFHASKHFWNPRLPEI